MKNVSVISAFAVNAIICTGGPAKEVLDLPQRQAICSQFIIEDPGTAALLYQFRDCCNFGHYSRNCHLQSWDDIDR